MNTGIGSVFAFSFNLFLDVAELCQKAVVGLLGAAINLILISPDPSLNAAWYRGEYSVVLQISLWLLIPIIFAATIGALMRGGLQQVLRTYCWALPIGIFGGVVTIALVDLAIKLDNEMTVWVFSNTKETVQSFYDSMNKTAGDQGIKTAGTSYADADWSFVQMICMVFFLFLLLFLVLEMFFRNVMIYMAVLFIPFSLAAYIWGPIRVWFYNLCELVTTMVFAKFVIAAILSFGMTAMAYATTGNGTYSAANLTMVFGSLVVMGIACISGPVIVTYVMSPSHSILSFKAAKQITPWNHDRKFAGQLFKANYGAIKEMIGSGGG
jgi:MFS family permease